MKQSRLSGRTWFNLLFFGLIGQVAWVVENMYFATLCQDIYGNSGRPDLSYIVTTLMVILSALTATVTTFVAGAKCDKVGKRKPFIAIGYILWGVTIMIFALIPMKASGALIGIIGVLLVLFDCIMTVAGSTSNDAAFNAFVADQTSEGNRGRVNAILSMLPVFAVIIVFIGLGGFYHSDAENNVLFFLILGAIPMAAGVVGLFTLKDAPQVTPQEMPKGISDTFYGFKPQVVKENKLLYVCLLGACVVAISQQTFFSYLMNFVIKTLGYGDGFVVPVAVIIVGAAVVTGVLGVLFDKFGRKHFYLPLLLCMIMGTASFFVLQYLSGAAATVVLYAGGVIMMGSILALTGALSSKFQDLLPKGCEGRFQGVRMCFMVLIPMIIGPIISMIIGLDAMGMNGADFAPTYEIFLAAAIVAVVAVVPLFILRQKEKK